MLSRLDKVCVYGITGRYGSYHTMKMLEYGTNIVCGISKRKVDNFNGIPVYSSLSKSEERPTIAILFVPAPEVLNAFYDAVENGIEKVIVITEHVPIHDVYKMFKISEEKGIKLIGPNSPGIIVPGEIKVGIMPDKYFKKGSYGIISRSGTLMYEIANIVSQVSGIRIAIGLGGDPIVGMNVAEAFEEVKKLGIEDVILIGEIGGVDEVRGVRKARENGFRGRIITFFAGRFAPEGVKMGHAGALIDGNSGKISYKEEVLSTYDVISARSFEELYNIIASISNSNYLDTYSSTKLQMVEND